MDVAAAIVALRTAQGLSTASLARLLGVSRSSIDRWEKGEVAPSPLAMSQLRELGLPAGLDETSEPPAARDDHFEVRVRGVSHSVEPAPYVVNGQADQAPLFRSLYELQGQTSPRVEDSTYMRRLSAVTRVDLVGEETAQSRLENVSPHRKSWNSNYGSHGWHRYVGRFPPHIVRAALNGFNAAPGDTVLDPFAGSGTTLLEARLLGLRGIGVEISPLSALIARTKACFPADAADRLKVLQDNLSGHYPDRWRSFVGSADLSEIAFEKLLERRGNAIGGFPNFEKWMTKDAFLGCSIIVEMVLALDDGFERDALMVALSSQMRSIGNVDVDVVRAEYRKEPRSGVDVLRLVQRLLGKMRSDVVAMNRTHYGLLGEASDITLIEGSVLDAEIPRGSVDCVITSPPYGVESLSYLRTHLLSFRVLQPILGADPYEANAGVIGSEYLPKESMPPTRCRTAVISEQFVRYFDEVAGDATGDRTQTNRVNMMMHFFDDMLSVTERLSEWVRPGGNLALVVGNKRIGDRIIPTDEIMRDIMESCGFESGRTTKHKLKTNNSNSVVPWQERTIQDEYIMLFKRSSDA